jgi:hypothetical protein
LLIEAPKPGAVRRIRLPTSKHPTSTRTPVEILAHIEICVGLGHSIAAGNETWTNAEPSYVESGDRAFIMRH